jgi:hypothetical protein
MLAAQPLAVLLKQTILFRTKSIKHYTRYCFSRYTKHTNSDIKNAIIAFVAWDTNDLPVKIMGTLVSQEPISQKSASTTINLIGGETFGEKAVMRSQKT